MADSRSNYSLTTFNSSGELVQIKHALAAVAERRDVFGHPRGQRRGSCHRKEASSTLVDETTVKIAQLTPEIGMTYSGMGPDFRVLTKKTRKETQVSTAPTTSSCPARKS